MHSPFHLSEVHHVVDGAGLTHHVEPPQACVCVAGVEGLEAVAQVSLTGHLSQFTGQILGSENTSQQGYKMESSHLYQEHADEKKKRKKIYSADWLD